MQVGNVNTFNLSQIKNRRNPNNQPSFQASFVNEASLAKLAEKIKGPNQDKSALKFLDMFKDFCMNHGLNKANMKRLLDAHDESLARIQHAVEDLPKNGTESHVYTATLVDKTNCSLDIGNLLPTISLKLHAPQLTDTNFEIVVRNGNILDGALNRVLGEYGYNTGRVIKDLTSASENRVAREAGMIRPIATRIPEAITRVQGDMESYLAGLK